MHSRPGDSGPLHVGEFGVAFVRVEIGEHQPGGRIAWVGLESGEASVDCRIHAFSTGGVVGEFGSSPPIAVPGKTGRPLGLVAAAARGALAGILYEVRIPSRGAGFVAE